MARINVTAIEFHRNGVSGESFYAITFMDKETGAHLVAVVFPPDPEKDFEPVDWERAASEHHNPSVAVLNADRLPDVRKGYRGDYYAPALYRAIAEYTRHFGAATSAGVLMKGDTILEGVTWRTITETDHDDARNITVLTLDNGKVLDLDSDARVKKALVTPSEN